MKKRTSRNEFSRCSNVGAKAIALLSGGLDSTLAAALVRQVGIEVIGLYVETLFDTESMRAHHVATAAKQIGIPVRTLDLAEEQMDLVAHPKHGYGKGMNPCLDCRILMLKAAAQVMEEEGAHFVITGEVLGQRPMSQHRRSLELVAEESGLGDRLLRPLSANLLPDTLPVKEGWIRREDLLGLSGRSRQSQIALAKRLGIRDYPQPAGGCLLLAKAYTARLRDAFTHIGKDAMTREDFLLLRYGRHFRISDRVKVIVGRNERENEILEGFTSGRIRLEPRDVVGPLTLVEGDPSCADICLAASIAARYCDQYDGTPLAMKVVRPGEERIINVVALDAEDPRLSFWRIDETTR